jgi:hypothetical protein
MIFSAVYVKEETEQTARFVSESRDFSPFLWYWRPLQPRLWGSFTSPLACSPEAMP